jgi:cell division protein FtsB
VIFGVGLLAWASFLLISYLLTIHFSPTNHQGHDVQQLLEQKAKAEAERQELMEENQQLRARLKQAEDAVAQAEAVGRLPGQQPAESANSPEKSPPSP